MPHITLRGRVYWYRRRTPAHVAHVEPRREITHSLRTDSAQVAAQKAAELDREYDRMWDLLDRRRQDDASARHQRIMRICRARGFAYRYGEEIGAEAGTDELLRRIEALEASRPRGGRPAKEMAAAVLGLSKAPPLMLSQALHTFYEISGDKQHTKSEEQLRRWRNPREKAIADLISVVRDREIAELTREDLLAWRDALWARVVRDEINEETANKQISYVTAMLRRIEKVRRVKMPDMSDLKFQVRQKNTRIPYSREFIQERILAAGALSGMNDELRRVLFVMIETGMSISETVNLAPENIRLNAEIPHVRITPTANRELKTGARLRDMPLVGVSLMALRAQPEGFPRYRDKEAGASGALNKHLLENGLRPNGESAYSLRHSFEDRMIEAGADERMRSEMMGHSYKREKYGRGPTLEAKRALLERMALTPPPDV